MQLRPYGASGSLVSTLAGFFRYEREQAWTWEHQALIRTRAVAGSESLCLAFEQQRKAFLQQTRVTETLKAEVLKMRHKMRQHLDKSTAEVFDIKQGEGGVIDIEFLVQYWVLLTGNAFEQVVCYSDNYRQLESLAQARVISEETAQQLTACYQQYRALAHQQAMSNQPPYLNYTEIESCRCLVKETWRQIFDDS
jgi:glutamate-ammonia-ligase adenylyltransferase